MRRLFLDTNILLDFMLEREPHATFTQSLFAAAEVGAVELSAASLSFATIYYLVRKEHGHGETLLRIKDILPRLKVLSVDEKTVQQSVASGFKDFEDALQYFCALAGFTGAIVTRNGKDFMHSSIPILSLEEAAVSLL